jgi:hypothetical protein
LRLSPTSRLEGAPAAIEQPRQELHSPLGAPPGARLERAIPCRPHVDPELADPAIPHALTPAEPGLHSLLHLVTSDPERNISEV